MKHCPKCKRTYVDPTLNFCLEDGERLAGHIEMSDFPTEVMPRPAGLGEPGTRLFGAASAGSAPVPPVPEERPSNSIAVLPFAHLSSDPDDEYFCDGLAEELINALARVEDLKVVARSSSFSFKNKNVEIGQIGSILNVQNIVEGSVRKFGERMRITVQLVNSADGYHIWSDKYDTEMRDLFDVQDGITLAVVNALKSKLLRKDDASQDEPMSSLIEELRQHAQDVEAYQLYLRGRFFANKFNPGDFDRAIECFTRAIEIDPTFAAAYAGLADVHVLSTEFGAVPSVVGMPMAKDAALKAISLDPKLSEAHSALGLVLQEFDFDFPRAESEYQQAIELNPNNAMAYQYYGALLAQLARHQEAETMCLKAHDLDPLSAVGNWIYPFALFLEGRLNYAIQQAGKVLELDNAFPAAFLVRSFAHHMKQEPEESVENYTRFLELCSLPEIAARGREAFEREGWEAFLRSMTAEDIRQHLSSYITAVYFHALGDNDLAFQCLEESYEKREGFIVMLKVDPRFEDVRNDRRFRSLIKRIGF